MKKFNVAVIGYGWASGAHIAAINGTSLAQVTVIHSSRPQDAAALSARHGCALETTRDLEGLLRRSDIHAVSICGYPQQHAAQIIAAARAGKHMIIEKPITLSIEDAREACRAVAAAGVKTCVCFEVRFAGQFQTIKSVIDSGLLGTIHYGEVDYYHGIGPWYGQFRWNTLKEAGGSSLLSGGCHALDALLLCMGEEVEAVTAYGTKSRNEIFAPYEFPTTVVAILRYKDGRIGKVASVIDCLQPYYFHTHLVGSEGSLLDDRFHSNKIAALDGHRWSNLAMKLVDSGDVSDHPYQAQFEAFFSALDRGKEMPLTNLTAAMHSHRTVLAADLSIKLGREVQLKELS